MINELVKQDIYLVTKRYPFLSLTPKIIQLKVISLLGLASINFGFFLKAGIISIRI